MKRIGATDTVKTLMAEDEMIPTKNVTLVGGGQGRILTQRQADQKAQMGYAFSFLSLGFVFAGFFVAATAIKDQKNGVLTRINLTGTSTIKYFTSKFVTSFTVTVIMTVITGISSFMLNIDDIGMGRTKFIAMIFMMGLILNTLSMLTGILMGDVMGGAVAVFTIWCMSSLLSGLYFPLTHTSAVIKVLSFMMPQRWFLEGTEMIFVGDNKAFGMLICTTAAYLMVFISLGSLGLKMRRTESWGTN
jgi:ABC-type multidrug transport system permease subunit